MKYDTIRIIIYIIWGFLFLCGIFIEKDEPIDNGEPFIGATIFFIGIPFLIILEELKYFF